MKSKKRREDSNGTISADSGTAYYDDFGGLHISLYKHNTNKTGKQNANAPRTKPTKPGQTPPPKRVRHIINHYSYCPFCKQTGQFNANHYRSYHQVEKIDDEHFLCKECRQVFSVANFLAHDCEVRRNERIAAKSTAQPAIAIQKPAAPRRSAPQEPSPAAPAVEIEVCEHCGYKYPKGFPHISVYHQNILTQEYHCPFCPALYRERRPLVLHMKAAHPVRFISLKQNKKENPPNPRLVACDLCKQRLHPNEVAEHMTHHPQGLDRSSKKHPSRIHPSSQGNHSSPAPISSSGQFDNRTDPEFDQDGGRYLGFMSRENGRFGSLPEYDDYCDEADA